MTRQSYRYRWVTELLGLTLISILTACQSSIPSSPETDLPQNSPGQMAEDLGETSSSTASEANAFISAVESFPVWLTPVATGEEQPAASGISMVYGDALRTEKDGLAQVELVNGLAFRIGGDATLILQPDNRLNLVSGEMITWVNPGQQVPTEIVTPAGIVGLRGTTLFVSVPSNEEEEVLFFAWEGTIRLQVAAGAEEILLKSGEELRVRPGELDVTTLRRRVRRLGQQEIRQRRRRSPLLNRFQQPLPTREQIEATLEAAP